MVLLALAVVAGTVALVQRHAARRQATVALARQLGAEAVSEPRIDLAMLLARQAVTLNDSSETQGTLLATLLRSPSVTGTMEYAFGSRPQLLSLSPDGRSLAVSDNQGTVRVYNTTSHRVRKTIHDFGYTMPIAFTPDGRYAVGLGGTSLAKIDIRRATTFALVKQLSYDKLWWHTQLRTKGGVGGFPIVLVSKDDRFVYLHGTPSGTTAGMAPGTSSVGTSRQEGSSIAPSAPPALSRSGSAATVAGSW